MMSYHATTDIRPYSAKIDILVKEYANWIWDEIPEEQRTMYLKGFNNREAFWNDFRRKYLSPNDFAKSNGIMFMAFDQEILVAMVSLIQTTPETVELKRNYVSTKYRRKGIARTLIKQLITEAKSRGYEKIILDSANFMTNAHRLYAKLGFEETTPFGTAETIQGDVPATFFVMELTK